VGIPIPEVKLPKIGGKDNDKQKQTEKSDPATQTRSASAQDTLRAVTGTMRKLTERELLLQVEKLGILRFRVLLRSMKKRSSWFSTCAREVLKSAPQPPSPWIRP
jgi:hypothetical protein